MVQTRLIRKHLELMLLVSAALASGACGDDDEPSTLDSGIPSAQMDASLGNPDAGGGSPEASTVADGSQPLTPAMDASSGGNADAVYAMLWMVLGDETTTSYIQLTDSVDVAPSIDKAREFGGWVGMASVGGKLLVSDGDAPRLTAFPVDNLQWGEGQSLNFANTGASSTDFGGIWLLNDSTAYLLFETTSRVVFDPTALRIIDVKEDTRLEPTRAGGQNLAGSYHRRARLAARDRIMIPFYYYTENSMPGPSIIASYDPNTHAEAQLTEINCEGLEIESHDEEGNAYYSPWWSWQAGFLYGMAPAGCVVRIKPDGTVDTGWPKDFLDVTGGRPVSAWHYVKDGKAVANVLHKEEIDVTGPFNPDLELSPYYPWFFDLRAGTAHKIEGIPPTAYTLQVTTLSGRTFLLVTNPDWTSTTAYELDVASGTVRAVFTTPGWLYDVIRVK